MTPSPDNTKRLHELSGWNDEYTLGFLVRKLPREIMTGVTFLGKSREYEAKHYANFNFFRSGKNRGTYTCYYSPLDSWASSRHWSDANTPEDAVCLTLISLFESGEYPQDSA